MNLIAYSYEEPPTEHQLQNADVALEFTTHGVCTVIKDREGVAGRVIYSAQELGMFIHSRVTGR